jgi:hypothetical protein
VLVRRNLHGFSFNARSQSNDFKISNYNASAVEGKGLFKVEENIFVFKMQ